MHVDRQSIALAWAPLLDGLPAPLLDVLAPRYAEAHRAYHGVAHISALAQLFVDVAAGPGWHVPVEVKLAILFHDAIYEPGRPDNESRSAELAVEKLRGICNPAVDVDRIAMMIRATKSHDQLADPRDHDLAHFIDADMAIIGTRADVYDAYTEAVQREFASIPTELFTRGRAAFLATQLARDQLFHTPWFRARYGGQARANLQRELASLSRQAT